MRGSIALTALALAACGLPAAARHLTDQESLEAINIGVRYASDIYHINCRAGNGNQFRYSVRVGEGDQLIATVSRKIGKDAVQVTMRRGDLRVIRVRHLT